MPFKGIRNSLRVCPRVKFVLIRWNPSSHHRRVTSYYSDTLDQLVEFFSLQEQIAKNLSSNDVTNMNMCANTRMIDSM